MELVVDFRRNDREHSPVTNDWAPVETVNSLSSSEEHARTTHTEEGSPSALLPQMAVEIWSESPHPYSILHRHNREDSNWLDHWTGKPYREWNELHLFKKMHTKHGCEKRRRILATESPIPSGIMWRCKWLFDNKEIIFEICITNCGFVMWKLTVICMVFVEQKRRNERETYVCKWRVYFQKVFFKQTE